MPPWILAAIAALSAAIPTLIALLVLVAPTMRRWLAANVDKATRERLFLATRGAFFIVADIASKTPGFLLDDGIAKVLEIVSSEIKATLGRDPSAEELRAARHIAVTMSADPNMPGNLGTGSPIAALALPLSKASG